MASWVKRCMIHSTNSNCAVYRCTVVKMLQYSYTLYHSNYCPWNFFFFILELQQPSNVTKAEFNNYTTLEM